MSKNIFEIKELQVTAFVGKDGDASVQITIGESYETLTEKQILKLIHSLISRVTRIKGYRATD